MLITMNGSDHWYDLGVKGQDHVYLTSDIRHVTRSLQRRFHITGMTFDIGIQGQEWYLIVSIPDLCTLTYFEPDQDDIYLKSALLLVTDTFYF